MRCPRCKTEIEPGTKSCPNCNRLIVISPRERPSSQGSEYTGVLNQQGKVSVDLDIDEDIKIVTKGQDDSLYSDILKPHSSIEVKGAGTRMDGSYHVKPVRHQIADSSKSEQKIRCPKCRTENERKDKFCRKCRTRISS